MITDIEQLLTETKLAFDKSPIKEFAIGKSLSWYYSISSTKLTKDSNVIVGFNWGASDSCIYEPQTKIPTDNFKELYYDKDKNSLGSIKRICTHLKEYLPDDDIDNCIQTNFCFFRSKEENQIASRDLELSTPLFQKLLDIIEPRKIIGFSSKLRDYFLQKNLCSFIKTLNVPSNRKTLSVMKGIFNQGEKTPIYFLPHPNAKFTAQARQNAWEFCFK